ncbi:MAG: glycerophosphodiester phosphodiesterase [Tistlia sp.]|uniref:glycerophosphodiester phosphodiesterase n=1 Tax=Tistlia sp. TaxID=3057121 RepID=UPI0034A465ED
MSNPLPRVIGHRGAASHAPENTLAGLRKAAELGAPWVEFDVRLTADKVAILHHDDSLKRTAGRNRAAAAMRYAEIAELEAGAWFGESFRGEAIPSLTASIALLGELGLGANIEIKPAAGQEAETARIALEIMRAEWPQSLPPPLITSFKPQSLQAAQESAPEIPRGLLLKELKEGWRKQAERLDCVSIHLSRQKTSKAAIDLVHKAGYALAVYTVNDPREAARLYDWGADCIITDSPELLLPLA